MKHTRNLEVNTKLKNTKKENKKKTKRKQWWLNNIVPLVAVIVSMATLISTIGISRHQSNFDESMKLYGDKKIENLNKITSTVSDIQTLSNNIELTKTNKDSDKLEAIYNQTFKLQNSFYPYLDKENKHYKELDEVLTQALQTTREESYTLLMKLNVVPKSLPKAGGAPVKVGDNNIDLDKILLKYTNEEQKRINELAK